MPLGQLLWSSRAEAADLIVDDPQLDPLMKGQLPYPIICKNKTVFGEGVLRYVPPPFAALWDILGDARGSSISQVVKL